MERTVLRSAVAAQTPQGFPDNSGSAHAAAGGEGASDDAALVERLGHDVRLAGFERNLKITRPRIFAWLS